MNIGAPGTPVPGDAAQVAGSDGTTLRTLSTSATGALNIAPLPAGTNSIGTVLNGQGTPRNSTATSAANTANVTTIAAVAGQSIRLLTIDYFTSAGTATLTVQDGATTIFSGATSAARTLSFAFQLMGTSGNAMTITVGAAGVGNTSTLNVVATQY